MKSISRRDSDRGIAIVLVLIVMVAVAAVGLGLVSLANTDRAVAANFLNAVEARFAAEALLERAVVDVRISADLSALTSGGAVSTFRVGSQQPLLPSGETIDLVAMTSELQSGVDVTAWGANAPVWKLYAYGPVAGLGGGGEVVSRYYGVVWLADDVADGDGDPSVDENGAIELLAESFGPRGSRHRLAATVSGPGVVTVLSWRDVIR